MTQVQLQAELARCDEEIKRCEAGRCIGAAIGWLDWQCEKRELAKEVTYLRVEITEA